MSYHQKYLIIVDNFGNNFTPDKSNRIHTDGLSHLFSDRAQMLLRTIEENCKSLRLQSVSLMLTNRGEDRKPDDYLYVVLVVNYLREPNEKERDNAANEKEREKERDNAALKVTNGLSPVSTVEKIVFGECKYMLRLRCDVSKVEEQKESKRQINEEKPTVNLQPKTLRVTPRMSELGIKALLFSTPVADTKENGTQEAELINRAETYMAEKAAQHNRRHPLSNLSYNLGYLATNEPGIMGVCTQTNQTLKVVYFVRTWEIGVPLGMHWEEPKDLGQGVYTVMVNCEPFTYVRHKYQTTLVNGVEHHHGVDGSRFLDLSVERSPELKKILDKNRHCFNKNSTPTAEFDSNCILALGNTKNMMDGYYTIDSKGRLNCHTIPGVTLQFSRWLMQHA